MEGGTFWLLQYQEDILKALYIIPFCFNDSVYVLFVASSFYAPYLISSISRKVGRTNSSCRKCRKVRRTKLLFSAQYLKLLSIQRKVTNSALLKTRNPRGSLFPSHNIINSVLVLVPPMKAAFVISYFVSCFISAQGNNEVELLIEGARQEPSHSKSIINGKEAKFGDYPWFVQGDGCAGVLIAPEYVLTAEHCGARFGGTIRIGLLCPYDKNNCGQKVEYRKAVRYFPHPKKRDLLLIKINRKSNIAPAPLDSQGLSSTYKKGRCPILLKTNF